MAKKHVLSLSYGKDSIACLEAIKRLNLPLDEVIHCEVMATHDIPADLPEMLEFKAKADKIILDQYGVKVKKIRANRSYEDVFYSTFKKGKREGEIYGFPYMKSPWCTGRLKKKVILAHTKKEDIHYIGIAADETERIKKHQDENKILPLVLLNWTEEDCYEWCQAHDLLSPIYHLSSRGGCWFCHNAQVDELRKLRKNHPEYWRLLLKWDKDSPVIFKGGKHTVADFDKRFRMEDSGKINLKRRFKWHYVKGYAQTKVGSGSI